MKQAADGMTHWRDLSEPNRNRNPPEPNISVQCRCPHSRQARSPGSSRASWYHRDITTSDDAQPRDIAV